MKYHNLNGAHLIVGQDSSQEETNDWPPIYTYDWDTVHKHTHELNEQLREIATKEPNLKNNANQAMSFIEDFYFDVAPRSLDALIEHNMRDITITITSTAHTPVMGRFCFQGNGLWSYTISDITINDKGEKLPGETKHSFSGLGYNCNSKEGEEPRYIFCIEDNEVAYFNLPETFSRNYFPMVPLKSKNKGEKVGLLKIILKRLCKGNKLSENNLDSSLMKNAPCVELKWRENYYDGPISGYCIYMNSLYRYQQVSEQEFSHKRIYSILPLKPIEKMIVFLKYELTHILALFLSFSNRQFIVYKIIYKILKFKTNHFDNREAVAYFTY